MIDPIEDRMKFLAHLLDTLKFDETKRYHVFLEDRPGFVLSTNSWLRCLWWQTKLGWINTFRLMRNRKLSMIWTMTIEPKAATPRR